MTALMVSRSGVSGVLSNQGHREGGIKKLPPVGWSATKAMKERRAPGKDVREVC